MVNKSHPPETSTVVGVISDTHGLLRPEAVDALVGSSLILHAGDIGKPEVLQGLQAIAPTIAVRGNNDTGAWAAEIPEHKTIAVGDVRIHIVHIVKELQFDPKEKGVQIVISGHSHKPLIEECEGVLFLNPGSAGARRFKLPVSVARLRLNGTTVDPEIIELTV